MIPSALKDAGNRIVTAVMAAPTRQGVLAAVQALLFFFLCTGCFLALGWTHRFLRWKEPCDKPLTNGFVATFLRCLIVPGLLEEILWRVVLQPPSSSWSQIALVNAAFSLYHVVFSVYIAETFDGRMGARAVFCDPTFLVLAFMLGNACSYAYFRSDFALWPPMLVHAIAVTLWLCYFGGEQALLTPGGLATTRRQQRDTSTSSSATTRKSSP